MSGLKRYSPEVSRAMVYREAVELTKGSPYTPGQLIKETVRLYWVNKMARINAANMGLLDWLKALPRTKLLANQITFAEVPLAKLDF